MAHTSNRPDWSTNPRFPIPAVALLLALGGSIPAPSLPVAETQAGPVTAGVKASDYAVVLHVSATSGSGGRDGSARRPFATLEEALRGTGETGPKRRVAIFVAAGEYGGATVVMKPWVDLFGGFEPAGWKRDVVMHRTALDGRDERRVAVGADHARLDGFHIVRGRVRGHGAGLLCEKVSPVVANNVFSGNRTLGPSPWNPAELHEPANDGGAVACIDGAAPVIEHNLFAGNSTEIGRGGALSCNRTSSPRIARNVFVENESGIADPKRSSDGGAISVFDRSHPAILRNLVVRNRALTSNDAGGVFVALWSSPLIEGNTIVGNESGDDAGGLFIGGQEHRYSRPLDPMPPADLFRPRVRGNVFVGNEQRGAGAKRPNSGAMRITMESRALLENNFIAGNPGGVYLQRSELVLRNNTILDPVLVIEEKAGLAPIVLLNSILRGGLDLQTRATVRFCNLRDPLPGEGNFTGDPGFADDGFAGRAILRPQAADRFATMLAWAGPPLKPGSSVGRPIRAGAGWSVVRNCNAETVELWGRPLQDTQPGIAVELNLPPSYRLKPDSTCIDSGTNEGAAPDDFDGDARPLRGVRSPTVDVGADEHRPPR